MTQIGPEEDCEHVFKIDPAPLTEPEKRQTFKKQKSQDRERTLKKRLHEMNQLEKKSKELSRQLFAEKRKKNIVNFFGKNKLIFNIVFSLDFLLFLFCLFSMEEVRNYKLYRLPH